MNARITRCLILGFLLCLVVACTSKPDLNDPAVQEAIAEARNLGLGFLEENRLDDAETQFQQLTELNPDDATGYANLGIVNLRRGDFTEAEHNLKLAIERDPVNPEIRLNLADAYAQMNAPDAALQTVQDALTQSPDHVPSLYKFAELTGNDEAQLDTHVSALEAVVNIATANIVPRIQYVLALIQQNSLSPAAFQLNELEMQLPELPREVQPHLEAAKQALEAGDQTEALRTTRIFHNLMKVTPYYQTGLRLLGLRSDALAGIPVISEPALQIQSATLDGEQGEDILDVLTFTDASANAGLSELLNPNQELTTLLLAEINGDTETDIFVAAWDPTQSQGAYYLLESQFGRFTVKADAGFSPADSPTTHAAFVDFDNDTFLDLYLANEGAHQLFKGAGDGTFTDVSQATGVAATTGGNKVLFADLDHDGDLDFFLAKEGQDEVYRNNADGSFTENAAAMGLAGSANTLDVDFGDFDDDGDLDLITTHPDGVALYSNQRQGQFDNIASAVGLDVANARITTADDYNNDGFLDLMIAGESTNLFLNNAGGTFTLDNQNTAFSSVDTQGLSEARFLDFDNDGYLDLLLTGTSTSLFHNDGNGGFEDVTSQLLPDVPATTSLAITDYNLDRDVDLFFSTVTGPALYRNDGGHQNRSLSVQTRGLLTGNSKNNYYSIGAKVEIRAGDLYQMRIVTEPTTYFGLGKRLKADVVRIVFTNGVPQNIFRPGTDQDIIEQQILKGSCPFLYTWNGSEFTFATDILWRSALGMPTGIMGGNTTYAPASPAEDYIKVPQGLLKPNAGRYDLRITGELWETPYFDEVKLLAIDHPDSIEVLIDERFGPPPAGTLPVYGVSDLYLPTQAVNKSGDDMLPLLIHADSQYVTPGAMSAFQGLTETHELILTLPKEVSPQKAVLYVKGWIFPTDASINVALAQSSMQAPMPPRVSVEDGAGNWQTVITNAGFPMGKNKHVRIDLTDKLTAPGQRIRVQTNMQVYWDHAFFVEELSNPQIRRTELSPVTADLQYRGFSKMYRSSPKGPHLFDYYDVSTEQRWRDLEGRYTRYGDVLPLLQNTNDQYVIMNAGDEIALSFNAEQAPVMEAGWTRSFILYSNGWLKDGDMNTANGNTVDPLPFIGMTAYPYGNSESYPMSASNRQYMESYNTRVVSREAFQNQLKP